MEERLDVLLRSAETVDHDVGFLFLLSSVANYRKTGDPEAAGGDCWRPACCPPATIWMGNLSAPGRTPWRE